MAATGNERIDPSSLVALIARLDASLLGDDELAEAVIDAELLLNAAHAWSAVALEEFERRGAWTADGALSAARWVADRTGSSTHGVRARTRVGAGLRLLPAAAAPARAGRLSPAHLTALAGASRRQPHLAARDEALLVEQATSLDAASFTTAVRHWEACSEAVDGPDPTEMAAPVDALHFSRTFDGRYQLDGSFSDETGQLVAAALDAEVDRALRAARGGDPSVPPVASRVRAGALVDLLTQTMRREPSDQSVPDRYRVAVVVRSGQAGEPPPAACDSAAFRIVLGADAEVLDVGRLTQQWPAGIRRAITFRDAGCVFPGCDRRPSWCDIHHCQPWSKGGGTSVANGALLCRRHHTFVHGRRWSITVEEGEAVTRRPDGSRFTIDRWHTTSRARNDSRQAVCSPINVQVGGEAGWARAS